MASFGCGAWAQELLEAAQVRDAQARVAANLAATVEEPCDRTKQEQALEKADPIGPGWFDSSWDLMRGLVVSEGLPADAELDAWLAGELTGSAEELEFA